MIDDMAANTYLGKRATKLLKYYAGCKAGFRPALAEVQKNTGILGNIIWNIRQELIKRAVISYKPYQSITINWEIIRTLAGLPEPLTMRGKEWDFYPVERRKEEWPMLDWKVLNIMKLYTRNKDDAELSPEAKHFFNFIERMTLREYHTFMREFWHIEPVPERIEEDRFKYEYWYPEIVKQNEADQEQFEESEPLPF